MKKLRKPLSFILAALMLISVIAVAPITASADTVDVKRGDELWYRIYDEGDIVFYLDDIPDCDSVNDQPWYQYRDRIKDISCSEASNIGKNSFAELPMLGEISQYFTDLVRIGERAFYHCRNVEMINVSSSKSFIVEEEAFALCNEKEMSEITLNNAFEIGERAFYDCDSKSINLSEGLKTIGKEAFADNASVTEVVIPESCTSIDSGAFKGCDKLTKIFFLNPDCEIKDADAIPSGAEIVSDKGGTVEAYANSYGRSFKKLTEGTTGDLTWNYDSSTGTLTVSGNGKMGDRPIEWSLLSDFIKNVVIKNGVTSICKKAFYFCDNLESAKIPKSVTSIEEEAFAYCSKLESISLPNSIKTIGEDAFISCKKIDFKMPRSLEEIGESAFSGTGLSGELEIYGNVSTIGENAFSDCEKLTSVIIYDGVKKIGDGAFFNNDELKNIKTVTIPSTVDYIGKEFIGYIYEKEVETEYIDEETGDISYDFDYVETWDTGYVTIKGVEGSCAETYAKENDIKFEAIESYPKPGPTEPEKTEPVEENTEPESTIAPEKETTEPKSTTSPEKDPTELKSTTSPNKETTEPKATNPGETAAPASDTQIFRYLPSKQQLALGDTIKLVVGDKNGDYKVYTMTATPIMYDGVPVYSVSIPSGINPEIVQVQVFDGDKNKSQTTIPSDVLKNSAGKVVTSDGKYYGENKTVIHPANKVKAANPMKVTAKAKTVKLKKLKKKAQKAATITVKNAKGKLSYKLVSVPKKLKKLVKINKKGVVTFKKWKKAKKGTYSFKVQVTAAGDNSYSKAAKSVTVKVKVK
ncbi:MAG: leucine-rich repeat protein [Ruminococcus sp.]|nr:leucine-rich repeat protein [Ruminococcus sp.]